MKGEDDSVRLFPFVDFMASSGTHEVKNMLRVPKAA